MPNVSYSGSLTCPNCHASVLYDPQSETVQCPYCNSYVSVSAATGESEAMRMERMRLNAQMKAAQMQQELRQEAVVEQKAKIFRKSPSAWR